MEKSPFLSIILPVYNVENYLKRCLDGLLNEAFQDYEMLLVDDGSPDSCPQICDEYARRRENIRVIHKPNGGLSSARNAGLAAASGDYIFFLDSDDYLEEGALTVIAEKLREKPVDILKFNYITRPAGCSICSSLQPGFYAREALYAQVIPLALAHPGLFTFSAWSHIYRRDFLCKNGLQFVSEREIGSEDYLFNLQTFLKADSLYAIPDALYDYDYREGSLTGRYRTKLVQQYRQLYLLMRESLLQNPCGEALFKNLDAFYVWNSYYTLMYNEYRLAAQGKEQEALCHIRELLRQQELRKALKETSLKGEPLRRRVIWLFINWKFTAGLWTLIRHSQQKQGA